MCKRTVALTLHGVFRLHDTKRGRYEEDSKRCDATGRTPEEAQRLVPHAEA